MSSRLTINGIDKITYSEFWNERLQIQSVKQGVTEYNIDIKWKGFAYSVVLSRICYKKLIGKSFLIELATFTRGKTIQTQWNTALNRPEHLVYRIETFMKYCDSKTTTV